VSFLWRIDLDHDHPEANSDRLPDLFLAVRST